MLLDALTFVNSPSRLAKKVKQYREDGFSKTLKKL